MKPTLRDQIAALDYCASLLESTAVVRTAISDPTAPIIAEYAAGARQALATLRALEPVQEQMRDAIRKSRGQV